MKFDHVCGDTVEVIRLSFDSVPLPDRGCTNCGGTRFFMVEVVSEDERVKKFSAICEGCKRIVELQ
jgi:hypothetical protein